MTGNHQSYTMTMIMLLRDLVPQATAITISKPSARGARRVKKACIPNFNIHSHKCFCISACSPPAPAWRSHSSRMVVTAVGAQRLAAATGAATWPAGTFVAELSRVRYPDRGHGDMLQRRLTAPSGWRPPLGPPCDLCADETDSPMELTS